jgi:hypothetical protein
MIVNWAYVGGFFDGEGTMNINGNSCRAEMYQQDLPTLENIQKFLASEGITSNIVDQRTTTKVWFLRIHSRQENAKRFMERVLPYCQRKRTVVQDGLRYIKLFPLRKSGTMPRHSR